MGKLVYDKHSKSPCIASAGIIGANMIKLANWEFDFVNKTVQFSDKSLQKSESKELITASFSHPLLSGTPLFSLKVEGVEIESVLFDVGYNGGLILPDSYLSKFSDKPNSSVVADSSTSGIYGSRTDTVTTKELHVEIGNFKTKIPVSFSRIGKALLGTDFLEHFDVYLNYDSNTFALKQQSEVEIEHQVSFIPKPLTDSTWVVILADKKSPIQLGDTLLSVNGKQPVDLFDNDCEYFYGIKQLLTESDSVKVNRVNGKKQTIPVFAKEFY